MRPGDSMERGSPKNRVLLGIRLRSTGRTCPCTRCCKGCVYKARKRHGVLKPSPRCSMKLWTRPLPRPLRFHDLRHTTATLLLKAGVPLATVQRILRHSDPAITTEVYGHLDVEDMRKGLDQLHFAEPERT